MYKFKIKQNKEKRRIKKIKKKKIYYRHALHQVTNKIYPFLSFFFKIFFLSQASSFAVCIKLPVSNNYVCYKLYLCIYITETVHIVYDTYRLKEGRGQLGNLVFLKWTQSGLNLCCLVRRGMSIEHCLQKLVLPLFLMFPHLYYCHSSSCLCIMHQ